jgi:hypothetical protein
MLVREWSALWNMWAAPHYWLRGIGAYHAHTAEVNSGRASAISTLFVATPARFHRPNSAQRTQALHIQVSQTASRNRLHSIDERLARTIAAITLQEADLIKYSRGKITVLDRPGLERASCEC